MKVEIEYETHSVESKCGCYYNPGPGCIIEVRLNRTLDGEKEFLKEFLKLVTQFEHVMDKHD